MLEQRLLAMTHNGASIIIPVFIRNCQTGMENASFLGNSSKLSTTIESSEDLTPEQYSHDVKIEEGTFTCFKCPFLKTLTTEKILKYHIKDVYGEKKYQCKQPGCTYKATSELRLYRHSCRPPAPTCDLCGARAVDRNKHHYNVHKSHVCDVCQKEFEGYNGLRKHQEEEHSKVPNMKILKKKIVKPRIK